MIIHEWLTESVNTLTKSGIGTARLDALVILGDVTGKDRAHLLAHPELELTSEQQLRLQNLLNRRAQHEPLAYIRQKTEFYGREFMITHAVLEPRPESETIIELLKSQAETQSFKTIVDIGTGSGALAITAKLDFPKTQVFAVDIDQNCLDVASQNAQKHTVNIELLLGNLLEPLFSLSYDQPVAVLANLPYVPDDYVLNQAAMQEPKIAIFGGPDGLDLYRTMFQQLNEHFPASTVVFTESLPFQHAELMNIAAAQDYTQIAEEDFIQVFAKE